MKITFLEKDQLSQNETTNYWFDVDGNNYAISDCGGQQKLLDCDGCPVTGGNSRDLNIEDALLAKYVDFIDE